MEITKREILVSIIIFFVLLSIGFLINNLIIENYILNVEEYNKALKINNDSYLYKYSVDTEVGNILVYGDFKTENGAKFDELSNDYAYIEKQTERYTSHSRRVCSKDSEGHQHCHTEYYYSWDEINREEKNINSIKFLGIDYNYDIFNNYPKYRLELYSNVIESKKEYVKNNYLYKDKQGFWGASVGDIRYLYYYTPKEFMGTIFIKAKNKTIYNISLKGKITIENTNLEKTLENKKNEGTTIAVIFWIIWLLIIGIAIYVYVYQDNYYLED